MIQFTVVARRTYGYVTYPLNFCTSWRHSHAPTKRFHNKPSQPGRLSHNQCSQFPAFLMKFNCVEMRSMHRWNSDDSQKIPIGSIFHIWSSSQWWLGEPMDMFQIHWIFAGRGDTLTPPPSDFTTNPRNQTEFSMDSILIFKRFGRNSFLLKCDHRLCESPATPQNSRWLPKNSVRVDFPHMIQFTVVARKTYGYVTNPLNFCGSGRHSHAHTKRFHNKPSLPDRLFHGHNPHFQAFWTKFISVEMRSSLMWFSGDSPKQQMTPKKFR